MRWWIVLALVGGCTTPAEDPQAIAETFCNCASPTGTTACVEQATSEVTTTMAAACSTCIYEYESSCAELEANCISTCFSQGTTTDDL